jgi:hypothetical protein
LIWRFDGEIAGLGTSAGPRIVVGRWFDSPLGSFADVMIEDIGGQRTLLAPSEAVGDFVATTYTFDAVVVGPVSVAATSHSRLVSAPGLSVRLQIGRRTPLGWVLRAQPRRLAASARWATVLDPVARRLLPGVRTRGSAGSARQEFYGATDLHRITAIDGAWRGQPLGDLATVDPPVTFGFGSAPRTPCLTHLVTTVMTQSE